MGGARVGAGRDGRHLQNVVSAQVVVRRGGGALPRVAARRGGQRRGNLRGWARGLRSRRRRRQLRLAKWAALLIADSAELLGEERLDQLVHQVVALARRLARGRRAGRSLLTVADLRLASPSAALLLPLTLGVQILRRLMRRAAGEARLQSASPLRLVHGLRLRHLRAGVAEVAVLLPAREPAPAPAPALAAGAGPPAAAGAAAQPAPAPAAAAAVPAAAVASAARRRAASAAAPAAAAGSAAGAEAAAAAASVAAAAVAAESSAAAAAGPAAPAA
eukprot:scaffold126798_cov51-Phaeocystis_antarctica.AAC.2